MSFGRRSARRRGLVMGAAIGSSRARRQAEAAASAAPPLAEPAASPTNDIPAEIRRFAELRDQGIITEEDFNAKKQQLLGL